MEKLKLNHIYQGDILEVLKTFPDESVDCVVTSPPYYGLRDYGQEVKSIWGGEKNCKHTWKSTERKLHGGTSKNTIHSAIKRGGLKVEWTTQDNTCKKCGAWQGQYGLEPTLEMYLKNSLLITAELKRVLKKTGTMFWNHGDSYGTGSGAGIRDGKQATNRGTQTNKKWQKEGKASVAGYEKSLLLQAHRLAIRMMDEQGWILRNQIIWHKPNCMPSSVEDRFTVDFEPIFFFTKSKKYWFESQYEPLADSERTNFASGSRVNGENKDRNDNDMGARSKNFSFPLGRNKRCVWKIPTAPYPDAHFATYPPPG